MFPQLGSLKSGLLINDSSVKLFRGAIHRAIAARASPKPDSARIVGLSLPVVPDSPHCPKESESRWMPPLHGRVKLPTASHPVQFTVLLVGAIADNAGRYYGDGYALVSGSGMQREFTLQYPKAQRIRGIDIQMPPALLKTLYPGADGEIAAELNFLTKGDDWQTLIYPKVTAAIRTWCSR